MTELLDYAWGHPNLAQLKGLGFTGVIRYVTGSGAKGLSKAEVAQIRSAGLTLSLVFETTGKTVKGGRTAGRADAAATANALNVLGIPKSVVFFAVDYDLQPAEYGLLDAYLDGAAEVWGKTFTGVYGGYAVAQRALSRGYKAWQTYAWSGGKVAQGISLYQYKNGQTVAGGSVDRNRTSLVDWSQVKWDGSTPAPVASSVPSYPHGTYLGYSVANTQRLLNVHGYHLAVDDSYGPATRAAVKDYQSKHGLQVDGLAGPKTQASLNAQPAPSTPQIAVDGVAGPATIKRWQQVLGTPVDGVVSGQLNVNYRPALTAVQHGNGGSTLIRKVQSILGTTQDGLFGPNTIKALQRYLGVNADGIFGPQTVKALQNRLNTGRF